MIWSGYYFKGYLVRIVWGIRVDIKCFVIILGVMECGLLMLWWGIISGGKWLGFKYILKVDFIVFVYGFEFIIWEKRVELRIILNFWFE